MATCPSCRAEVPETAQFCAQCGASVGPSKTALPPRPSAARKSLVVFLLAGILLGSVVVGTIAFALLATPGTTTVPMPTATFGTASQLPYETHVPVGSMSVAYPPSNFLLRMGDGSATSQYIGMSGNLTNGDYGMMTMGADSYAVFWMDRGIRGRLDAGDEFLVSPMHGSACPAGGVYLMLYWMNRTSLATSNFGFDCTSKVTMTLGTPSSMGMMNGSMTIPVNAVSAQVMPMNFMARVLVGSNLSYPVWMGMGNGTSIMMSGYASSFNMGWTDGDGSGTLSPGDRLFVGMPSMMASGVSMTMYLEWRDGSAVASASWTT